MNKKSGDILLLAIGGLLMAYTAFRSMDILRTTLPANAQIMAYIGLAGLDGGLLAWVLYLRHSARGETQRAVSYFMVCIQLAGVALTSVSDSLLNSAGTQMPEYILTAVTWGVPGIIALNVTAITVVHLSDPRAQIEHAKQRLEDEIDRQVAEQLIENASQIASAVAADAAVHQAEELIAAFRVGKGGQPGQAQQPPAQQQAQAVGQQQLLSQLVQMISQQTAQAMGQQPLVPLAAQAMGQQPPMPFAAQVVGQQPPAQQAQVVGQQTNQPAQPATWQQTTLPAVAPLADIEPAQSTEQAQVTQPVGKAPSRRKSAQRRPTAKTAGISGKTLAEEGTL